MRSRLNDSISAAAVHDRAAGLLQQYLGFKDRGYRCRASTLISVLLYAASRITSISDACQRLRRSPSDDAVRQALMATWPNLSVLERRLNSALADRLPKHLLRRPVRLAMDITEIPYHGQPHRDPREVCRRQPRCGTSHFHCYATAFVIEHGRRLTLAVTYVCSDDSKRDIVRRLLRQVREKGLKIKYLLLDRGFYAIDVIRYLQSARCPFLMPVIHCGGRARDPASSQSTNRFLTWKRSDWSRHTLRNKVSSARVQIAVACDRWNGRKGKHGRRVWYSPTGAFNHDPLPGYAKSTVDASASRPATARCTKRASAPAAATHAIDCCWSGWL